MDIETAFYRLLVGDAGVSAIVAARIFPGVLPQSYTAPALVYRPTDRERRYVLAGGCSLVKQRIQIWSVARGEGLAQFTVAKQLDQAVSALLDEYQGTVSDGQSPESTLTIQGVFATSVAHQYRYQDNDKTHQFLTEYEAHYTDPSLVS